MNKTFTYGRAYFWLWLACLVVFSCFLIGSTVVPMLLLRTPRALVFVLPVGAFWSIFVYVSWRYLHGCWADKITFRDGEMEITQKGSTAVVAPRCESAEWEFVPDQELRIDLGSDWRLTIEFGRYDKELRTELIRACRDAIPHEVQRGWIADFDSPPRRRRHAVRRWAHRLFVFTFMGWFLSGIFLQDVDLWPWNSFWGYVLVTVVIFAPVCWALGMLTERKRVALTQDEQGRPQG